MNNHFANRITKMEPFHVMALLQRARQLESAGRDIIHMEIGEPDFPTPKAIIEAGVRHLHLGEVKYTPAAGLWNLREKIAAYYWHNYNVTVEPARIFITPGASGALLLALGICINPGDEVLMADPCYPCNSNFLHLFEAKAKTIPVNAQTQYQLTAELIKRNWTTASKGVLIASPSNPTGTVIEKAELKRIIANTEKAGGHLFSDEIYHGLTYGKQAATALSFNDRVFVINSFSKYFGMTGWRLGWLIVPETFIEPAEKLAQNIFISAPALSQYAALAAFDENNIRELETRKAEFAARRDFLYHALTGIGFKIPVKPEGAFYLYANCAEFTGDSYRFALNLLEAENVAVTPGRDFGSHLAHQHLRFAYTTTLERMAEAVSRIENFIKMEQPCQSPRLAPAN